MATRFLKAQNGGIYRDSNGKLIRVDMSLPALSNPATAEDITSGKEAYGADGVVITGTDIGAIPYRHTTWVQNKTTRNNSSSQDITATVTLTLPTQAKNILARQYYSYASHGSTTSSGFTSNFTNGSRILFWHEEVPTITPTSNGTTITASHTSSVARGGTAVWLQATYNIDGLSYTRNDDGTINLIGDENCTWLWDNYYVANSSNNNRVFEEFIKTIDLSKSINLTEIGTRVFYDYADIEKIVLPKNLESIGDYAFDYAVNLQEVDFGEDSQLKSLGADAFYGVGLQSIVLPQNLESIGNSAFTSSHLGGVINIPSKVSSIGNNPFVWCENLEGYTVDEGNTVYRSAGNCIIDTTNKTLVCGCKNSVIPNDGSVEIIGQQAFQYKSLTELTVPESVLEIKNGGLQLASSTNKATITMLSTTPPTLESTSALRSSQLNKIIVPIGCLEAYQTATNWSNYASYIEEATA